MITKFKDYLNEMYSNQFFKTYKETKNWLDLMGIENYTINDDLTVDVNGSVNLYNKNLTYIPVQFGKVTGYFGCYCNQLTSLKGCPSTVGDKFSCRNNKLSSFEYSPITVDDDIYCGNNSLTSLDGLSIYNFKKNIKKIWYKDLSSKIKEEYFDKNLDEHPEIFSLIDFELSTEFKDKWEHLFNAKKFDLI